jgi:hypothetical protein
MAPPSPPKRPPDNRPPTKPPQRPSRFCLTPDDAFAAGWDDGASDPPLTADEITRLVALHAPHLRPDLEHAT